MTIQYHGGPCDGTDRFATSPQPEFLFEQWPRPNAATCTVQVEKHIHLYKRVDMPTRYVYCGVQAVHKEVV